MSPRVTKTELLIALRESVRLQTHYAKLLNVWDQGHRVGFTDAEAWIERLKQTGHLRQTHAHAKTKKQPANEKTKDAEEPQE